MIFYGVLKKAALAVIAHTCWRQRSLVKAIPVSENPSKIITYSSLISTILQNVYGDPKFKNVHLYSSLPKSSFIDVMGIFCRIFLINLFNTSSVFFPFHSIFHKSFYHFLIFHSCSHSISTGKHFYRKHDICQHETYIIQIIHYTFFVQRHNKSFLF